MNNCPNCGHPLGGRLRRAKIAYAGYHRRHFTQFENSVDDALEPWQPKPPPQVPGNPGGYFEASRERPARPMNVESDVVTPLVQALALGGFVFGAFFVGGLAFKAPELTMHAACFSGLVSGGAFYFVIVLANRRLLWVAERLINDDLNGDGHVGRPPAPDGSPPPPLELEVVHRNEHGLFSQMFRSPLPAGVSEDAFYQFARAVGQGRGLAETGWTGRGKPFSRTSYSDLLDALTQAGLVRWINPSARAQGRELTEPGRRALRRYVAARTHAHANDANGNLDYEFIE